MLSRQPPALSFGTKVLKRAPEESGELTRYEVYNFTFMISKKDAFGFEPSKSSVLKIDGEKNLVTYGEN